MSSKICTLEKNREILVWQDRWKNDEYRTRHEKRVTSQNLIVLRHSAITAQNHPIETCTYLLYIKDDTLLYNKGESIVFIKELLIVNIKDYLFTLLKFIFYLF